MKYTIELTNKQKAQMDCIIEIVHRYVGFNPKLEMDIPIPMTVSPAYKKGFEDGKKQAISEIPEIANNENEMYNRGYNTAINDYNMMIQWLHDCKDDFKEFMNKKYGYDIMYLTNPKVDEGVMLYDLICDHDIAEVISEFQKWQEEKKQAEDEIRVGDEVITSNGYIAIITFICDEYMTAIFHDGSSGEFINETLKKTGRHFGEVEQIIDKLRCEEDEKN